MKEEIKEILEQFKKVEDVYYDNYDYIKLNVREQQLLLDYITNLQEKYERMKENAEILSNGCNELEQRIDKAVEYINNGYLSDGEMVNILAQQDLLNLLQGKSDE